MPIYKKIGLGVLVSILAGVAQFLLWTWLQPLLWILFYPALILSALLGGTISSVTTGLSACIIIFFAFLPPLLSWEGKDLHALISAPIFLLVAYLVGRIHEQYRGLDDLLNNKLRITQEKLQSVSRLYEESVSLEDLHFSDFAESLPQIVWVTNAQGESIYFNRQWMDFTGMTLEESMGQGWNLPFHPDDQARAWEAWQNAVQRSKAYSSECRLRRADGEYCWWLIRGVPLKNTAGEIIKWFGTCTDIDEIKTTEEALASQKNKLETIFNSHPDGVAILDGSGKYEIVNPNYAGFYGYASPDKLPLTYAAVMQGFDVFELNGRPIPLDEMPTCRALSGQAVNNFEALLVSKQSGWQRYASISANPLTKNPVTGLSGAITSVRDITANIRDKAALIKVVNEQNLMLTCGIAGIAKTNDRRFVWINEVFARNLGYTVSELLGQSTQILYDTQADFDAFGRKISTASIAEGGLVRDTLLLKRKDGSHGWFLMGGGLLAKGGLESIWLSIDVTEEKKNHQLLESYVHRIEHSMHETLEVLAKTVEMHDPYTAGHQRRVGKIAREIGRLMGLPADALNNLELMGLIHDIGKIGIPAEILSKPGHLSPEELVLVHAHTKIGYNILSKIDFDIPIADVAFQHHERLDGSGYPNGLHDSQILLESRIIAVADVVEAMASHRPYRPALGLDKALAEIESGRATKYDSEVVDACMRLFKEENYQIPEPD